MGSNKEQYLTAKLWMQENRAPTEKEELAEKSDSDRIGPDHYLYQPALPLTYYELRYLFLGA